MIKKSIKKRPKRKTTKNNKPKFKLFALSNILVVITLLALGTTTYLYNQNENLKKQNINKIDIKGKKIAKEKEYQDQKAKYFEEKTKALDIEYSTNIEQKTYIENPKKKIKNNFKYEDFNYNNKKKNKIIKTRVKEKKKIEKKEPIKKLKQKEKVVKSTNPKLAIIIDDVTTSHQINKILKIGYNVNISFLPPTSRHKNSAKIASKLDNYMIHLPLEARNFRYGEENTLYVKSDSKTIENRIKILKKQYPKAKFINNHTGSTFTSNQGAMDRLFKILKKYNYTFIDSRTTSKSVAEISSKKYGVRLLSRNIFLDNKKDKKYIQNQLKKAIKIAKKHGSAIAIGHPYNITFQTLKEAKELLKGIDLVYVNKL